MSAPIANRWSDDEIATLVEEVPRSGGDWAAVAAKLPGRTPAACQQAWHVRQRQARIAKAAPAVAASPIRLKNWQDRRAREKAAEHERTAALTQQRSTTSEFFGDPLPGRSALDKKRAGISDEPRFDRRLMHAPKKPTLFTGGRA